MRPEVVGLHVARNAVNGIAADWDGSAENFLFSTAPGSPMSSRHELAAWRPHGAGRRDQGGGDCLNQPSDQPNHYRTP